MTLYENYVLIREETLKNIKTVSNLIGNISKLGKTINNVGDIGLRRKLFTRFGNLQALTYPLVLSASEMVNLREKFGKEAEDYIKKGHI